MRKILILGAGRSASSLIHYLITNAVDQDWSITIADRAVTGAKQMIGDHTAAATAVELDATDKVARMELVRSHDLVISMLPASMHPGVVADCIEAKRNIVTPSYVSPHLRKMEKEINAAGIICLNEMGLDPGIDHMSAKKILDRIKAEGGEMSSFESYTGGLVAPESDTNPWGYKFTWNPRNVVLAGQGGAARFVRNTRLRFIPYHKLFERVQPISVESHGDFDGYANRDSLKYRTLYGLDNIPTLVRGTLRKRGFCEAWNVFVQLGCTDDTYTVPCQVDMPWSTFFKRFLPPGTDRMKENLSKYLRIELNGTVMQKLEWLGVFSDEPIGLEANTPAKILQHLLEQKWTLEPTDKDMIIMWHRFGYTLNGTEHRLCSSLAVVGTDQVNTAMAQTVGLPIAIAAKLILNGDLKSKGILMPLEADIYNPVLNELETLGVKFREYED